MSLLEAKGLTRSFGGLKAVVGVDFEADAGEVIGLFGPNGAGKTTFFNLLAGALRPDAGRVRLDGHDMTALPAHRRAQLGLARTFQIVKPLEHLSVLDNVLVPLALPSLRKLLPLGRYRRTERAAQARRLLQRVGLEDVESRLAGALPLGMKKRLEVARALALEPRVLLLDEPLAGLTHQDAQRLLDVVSGLGGDMAIVLVEHNVRLAMGVCNRAVVMEAGAVIASGTPEEVRTDPKVIEAYLGDDEDA